MLTKIKCRQCNNEIEISEALESNLREQILATVNQEHQKHIEEARKKAIEETLQKHNEEHTKKLEETRTQALDEAKKSLDEKYATEF
ncbi:MAG TPA: hypothetical protein VEP90_20695, partial [Methylomirabilota bacterium]|nr:hypothetical protein [Methylomirabilota bacterium]